MSVTAVIILTEQREIKVTLTHVTDIHFGNVLVGRTDSLDHLSVDEFREKFGAPETDPVKRRDGLPLTAHAPPFGVQRWALDKSAKDFTFEDVQKLILSDLGESFSPEDEPRLGKDSHVPLLKRSPEALFEPDSPLSYASDIWSLGIAVWDILGMQSLFYENVPPDEIAAGQMALLGRESLPPSWREIWERPEAEVSVEDTRPHCSKHELEDPEPSLEEEFEERVLKWRREQGGKYGVFEADEVTAILALMRGMLALVPKKRMTAMEVLQSVWMAQWALPDLRRAYAE